MDSTLVQSITLPILFIWLSVVTFLLVRLLNHYQSLIKNTQQKDLVAALNELLKQNRISQQGIEDVNKRLDLQIQQAKLNFKKLGFKRFNPFTDTGGDQSFTFCLLDENNDGIVISSLHSRENTRLYAKRIAGGEAPDQTLSAEEKEIIKSTVKQG